MVELEEDESSRTEDSEAEDASQAPPAFLATLAHELRNPLAPIRNGTELLRSICSDPRQIQIVEMVSRHVVHLTRLLDDLLDTARLRRGQLTLRKQTVDVMTVVEQALDAVRPAIDASKQSLLVALPSESVRMHCDPVRLVQVLQNLLDNANRFTAEGGSISLKAQVTEGELVFEVADDGVGIDPALLPHLFNVFAQGEQQLNRPEGGLGLGLAIARNLVEMHGGSIAAHSPGRGQGSRFVVKLPVETKGESVTATFRTAGPGRIRTLVIDDRALIAASLADYLTERGHATMTADSGEAGLAHAQRFLPQAVVIDIGLPGIDGFEVARRFRSLPAFANTVLIAVSGYSLRMLRKPDEALFDHYVVKPVGPEIIASIIESAVRAAGAPGADGE
jgi:CheY-like chemotaxis protein/two-component sensor histidine kinase